MGLSNKLPCEAGSFFCLLNRHRYLQPDVLRVYFPAQESWVAQSVSLPSCSPGLSTHKCGTARSSSRRLPTHPLHPSCASPPLLPVWMNVSSLTPWLLDLHIVQFSVSSDFSVFKFVVVFLLVVQGGTVCLPMPSSWPEVSWLFKMGPGGNVYTMEVGKGLFSFWGAGCQTATSTALPGQWPYFC